MPATKPASPARRAKPAPVTALPGAFTDPAMARAVDRLAAAVEAHTAMAAPAHVVVAGVGDRLDGLCRFIRRKGPWLLASIPGVLLALGAITPNAAAVLRALLAGMAGQP